MLMQNIMFTSISEMCVFFLFFPVLLFTYLLLCGFFISANFEQVQNFMLNSLARQKTILFHEDSNYLHKQQFFKCKLDNEILLVYIIANNNFEFIIQYFL